MTTHAQFQEHLLQLARLRNLQECLICDLHWYEGLYTADVLFDYSWNKLDQIRAESDPPFLIRLRLIGVERLQFVGLLTEGMKHHPERIDWGLSEVAGVELSRDKGSLSIRISWEGGRQLTASFMSLEIGTGPQP